MSDSPSDEQRPKREDKPARDGAERRNSSRHSDKREPGKGQPNGGQGRPNASGRPSEGGRGNYRGDKTSAPRRDGAGAPRRDGAGAPRRDGGGPGTRGPARAGDKKLWTREGKPARGDKGARDYERELTEEERLARELRSVRTRHEDPEIPEAVQARDLDKVARAELKTLSKENADWVARHLVMAAQLIEDEPELAHQHALSAARRAGRVAVVRETLAITAYAIGDFGLALRELRTYRRISGSNDQLPLMVDSERGVGRADRALELGRSVDRATLSADVQVSLAIAMSGARLDLGQNDEALAELEIPQLDPNRAYSWSPELFHAYADVLDELGREEDADTWRRRAVRAEQAVGGSRRDDEDETVDIVEEELDFDDEALDEGEGDVTEDRIEPTDDEGDAIVEFDADIAALGQDEFDEDIDDDGEIVYGEDDSAEDDATDDLANIDEPANTDEPNENGNNGDLPATN